VRHYRPQRCGGGGAFLCLLKVEVNVEEPVDPLVGELVDLLDDDLRESWAERSAIVEFDAGLERAHAECLALLSVLARHPSALCRVRVLQFDVDGATKCLLTTDLDVARMHAGYEGGRNVRVVELRDVLDRQYVGLASLCTSG
jgi:hypothetical protein